MRDEYVKMERVFFFSNRLDLLARKLAEYVKSSGRVHTILVPNQQIGRWLYLEIAKRNGIAAGLKMVEPERYFPSFTSFPETFLTLYGLLEKSSDLELQHYLQGKEKRLIHLADLFSRLVTIYGEHEQERKDQGFQEEIVKKYFLHYPPPLERECQIDHEVICFGIDYLAPIYWKFLFSSPALQVYLFSPCLYYWEDTESDWERKSLHRHWKRRGAKDRVCLELDRYLSEAPRNLANWGRLGKETLKILRSFDYQEEECYLIPQATTLLKQVQFDLLHFENTKNPTISRAPSGIDDSIKLFLTGKSRLHEIEVLREEILKTGLLYHEISVLDPDIEPYVPLIEYVFGEEIPYRISGVGVGPTSSFRQGLVRLLSFVNGRWDFEALLTLFETPSFSKKQGWNSGDLQNIRAWLEYAGIDWGIDPKHREEVLEATLGSKPFTDHGSWERGLDRLLDTLIYIREIELESDLFEELIGCFETLKWFPVFEKKSLPFWAAYLEKASALFEIDAEDEGEMASFSHLLKSFKNFKEEVCCSMDGIQYLLMRPSFGHIHAAHLHAVQFSRLQDASLIPAKALFCIGMDEESFPTKRVVSSLDLSRGKKSIPTSVDRDRYAFLAAVFSCEELLRISYCHLSEEEGKPVAASLLVQELLSVTGKEIQEERFPKKQQPLKKTVVWPRFTSSSFSVGRVHVLLSELRQLLKHPWQFYLQKAHGIYLDRTLQETFALQKAKLLKQSLEGPVDFGPGMIGKALEIDILEKKEELLAKCTPVTLELREGSREPKWEDHRYIVPPLEVPLEKGSVVLTGTIHQTSREGMLSFRPDTIAGSLQVWSDALISSIFFGCPHLRILKEDRVRSIENPEKHLAALLEYFLIALRCPSPLLSHWTDPILRKGMEALEKARLQGPSLEDPVYDWVVSRTELPTSQEIFSDWEVLCKRTFSGLIALYPTTKKLSREGDEAV